jgi:dynein light intermediate chain, axonemal
MIPPVNSLVKYDNPILVASTKGKKAADPKAAAPKVPPGATQTEDILNSILPPRYVDYM